MSTLNPPKTISKRQELREDRVITGYARAWEFYERHRNVVYIALGVLVALVLGVAGYTYYLSQQGDRAQEALGGILPLYEQGDYRAALDGTEEQAGLLEIAEAYGGTDAGNLARFYAADALFRLGEYDQALEFFSAYDKESNLVGASAYAGMAAIYEIKEDYDRAGDLYRRAATVFENELTSPQYLLDAGEAYEKGGHFEEAIGAYELIQERYADSEVGEQVDFYLARVRAKQG